MIRRTVREWQRIDYGLGDDEIPPTYADRLAAVAQNSTFAGREGGGVLEHGRKGLRARGVVGVIAAPGCQLEILPKIEGAGETDPSPASLRKRLVHMLAVAYDLPIEANATAQLSWQRDTILEIMIRLFCLKLIEALRHGMPRRYAEQEEDLPTLRGRLNIARQFSAFAVSPQKLACRFDALTPDIALNQVMKAVVSKLMPLTHAPDNERMLRELSFLYADVSPSPTSSLRWDQIVLDRTNGRWRDLLRLARMFLIGRYQETSGGMSEGHALLFEMNVLFEDYVTRLLTKALVGTGLRVSAQGGHRDCLYDGYIGRFRTKPDILIKQDDKIVLVVDTKWKSIASTINDPKQGVSQSDIYQLMAYAKLYECKRVMLLYPHHGKLPVSPVRQTYAIAAQDAAETLIVATHDLSYGSILQKSALLNLINDNLAIKKNASDFLRS